MLRITIIKNGVSIFIDKPFFIAHQNKQPLLQH